MSVNSNRSTDGLTINKVVVGLLLSVIAYVCTSSLNKLDTIAEKVAKIDTKLAVAYEHQINMDARIVKNEHEILTVSDKFDTFYNRQSGYWELEYGNNRPKRSKPTAGNHIAGGRRP